MIYDLKMWLHFLLLPDGCKAIHPTKFWLRNVFPELCPLNYVPPHYRSF